MKPAIPRIILFVFLAVGTIVTVSGISSSQKETTQPSSPTKAAEVKVAAVARGDIARFLDLSGTVEPYRIAQIASPAEGPIMNIRVWEGDRVEVGSLLMAVGRKKGIDALIVSLREDVRKEEDNYIRVKGLVEEDALPAEQLDNAKSSLEKARSQLIKAEETMGDYSILAPWRGIVSRVKVREGDFVGPRAPLIEIYDPGSLIIRLALPEAVAAGIKSDMKLEVTLDAFPGSLFHARIVRLYPYLEPRTRTRTLEAKIIEPIEILPGMFARVRLQVESVTDALVAPVEAVKVSPRGKKIIFVVNQGTASRREVETGIENGGRIEIKRGLSLGEQVIVAGNENLTDGTRIQVREGKPQ
ncbi:MAG: efflux RND transporter periplasmic adaptor subunit [Deltaproteobacteria bacterium CG_4_8_14_3_um_filter_51_11]|nr:efflux RND transporter periplasmic adaptor subunit [bacterium]OIP43861.1 MAG: hypothetical protein AUK25_00265 [Desulfobacteraceae bacterium CG2_30_51_40]PIP45227.1 MAG: efflux transporter periplasmic adaptor subunit [Deltaproteobacteria bacterium CG23_combo_of_CG06-09_8_20_14_all_51_20]PIX20825.1 MAG: efflux RND transporter periplasmic adaptor subunit [Deltaproteobacteria bacterium CG_4_8_14_3_um_filter_51_11]PJB37414.1 MAG: efflux RND transporter periplasmic adaptor subunit [Deltaproteobac